MPEKVGHLRICLSKIASEALLVALHSRLGLRGTTWCGRAFAGFWRLDAVLLAISGVVKSQGERQTLCTSV